MLPTEKYYYVGNSSHHCIRSSSQQESCPALGVTRQRQTANHGTSVRRWPVSIGPAVPTYITRLTRSNDAPRHTTSGSLAGGTSPLCALLARIAVDLSAGNQRSGHHPSLAVLMCSLRTATASQLSGRHRHTAVPTQGRRARYTLPQQSSGKLTTNYIYSYRDPVYLTKVILINAGGSQLLLILKVWNNLWSFG